MSLREAPGARAAPSSSCRSGPPSPAHLLTVLRPRPVTRPRGCRRRTASTGPVGTPGTGSSRSAPAAGVPTSATGRAPRTHSGAVHHSDRGLPSHQRADPAHQRHRPARLGQRDRAVRERVDILEARDAAPVLGYARPRQRPDGRALLHAADAEGVGPGPLRGDRPPRRRLRRRHLRPGRPGRARSCGRRPRPARAAGRTTGARPPDSPSRPTGSTPTSPPARPRATT